MRKTLCTLMALSCAATLAACGSSDSSRDAGTTENNTIYLISSKKSDFDNIDHWLTDMWNTLICDIPSYIKYGKDCADREYDIDYAISELQTAYKHKPEYDEFIHSLDNSIEVNERLIKAWDKMSEQLDILYGKITTEKPRPKDESYEYNTDLYRQYYESFQDIEREIEKST